MSGTTNIPVVNVILRREAKVLFLLRKNTAWMNGFYGLPSGHVEHNESFREAACRELLEEVGIKIKPTQLEHRLTYHQLNEDGAVRVGVYFEAKDWQGEPINAEPDKHGEIAWFEPDNLPDKVISTTRSKFQDMNAGRHYVEYGFNQQ